MVRFIGLDVHKNFIEACFLEEHGERPVWARVPTSSEALSHFARRELRPEDHVALEATGNTSAIVDILEPYVAEVVISNPLRTRAIAEAKIKTDKIDAYVLAQLLRANYLPRVWQPDSDTRTLRRLSAHRAALGALRTGAKNRIHALLHQRLIASPFEDLFSKAGRRWLETLELDELGSSQLACELRLLSALEEEIAAVDDRLARLAYQCPEAKLLMTLPGVDFVVALALLGAVGDWRRFKDGDSLASYLGLVPTVRQSGSRSYRGPITKSGPSHARWLLVQAAQHARRHPGPLGAFYRRIQRKKNHNVAVVAVAHKLATIAWKLLSTQQPYRYAQPATTQAKLARLRVRATGKRRKGGTPKGSPRTALYGAGRPTRRIPSLPNVLKEEGLPELAPPPAGELRHMRQARVLTYARSIAHERRRPRNVSHDQAKR